MLPILVLQLSGIKGQRTERVQRFRSSKDLFLGSVDVGWVAHLNCAFCYHYRSRGRDLKIAFLNPWRKAAENQAFSSLRIAAERIGHLMVHCTNSAEIEYCAPDFVLASASTQPKLNDFPHYGVIHEPRDRFLTNRDYFNNLLSYDGYLTIADTLGRFLENVTYGTGRPRSIGFYYNTCQRQETRSDISSLIRRRALQITYFGTNWDKRRHEFFRTMSTCQGVKIHGPEHCWPHIDRRGYGGAIPFDGSSVQETYAANGIGLCLLSDLHLRDDIISNRIFEVTSVGAIAICCDIPWIRKHFGDSVYYINQNLGDRALLRAILKIRDSIYSNEAEAIGKAVRAREIFENHFAAEVMIRNAVEYHEKTTLGRNAKLRRVQDHYTPLISVIVRCGSRAIDYVTRAVESISRQKYGRFEIVFVRYKEIDLTPLLPLCEGKIASFQIVDCPGGNRSASLWTGLNAATGEYFSILDDDDLWFCDHFENLFQPFPERRLSRFMAYSGSIRLDRLRHAIDGGGEDDRSLYRFGIESRETWNATTAAFASNCFVASIDLLHCRLRSDPKMETAEDSYLILSLLGQVEPHFSYSATSLFDRSLTNQSGFSEHPSRFEDEMALQLRLFGNGRPSFLTDDSWKILSRFWEQRPRTVVPDDSVDIDTILRDWERVAQGYERDKSGVSPKSKFLDPRTGSASIQPTREPWSYGAELFLRRPSKTCWEYKLLVELKVCKGVIGVGLLNLAQDDYLFRRSLFSSPDIQTVLITIRDLTQIGRLVIQNWETPGDSLVELMTLRLLGEP
jgi:hypothetical protein